MYTGFMEDDWDKKRKKAKKYAIVGLVMALAAIVIDWLIHSGLDGSSSSDGFGEGMTYGYVTGFFLFPMMIFGLVLFVVNLFRFIKYK